MRANLKEKGRKLATLLLAVLMVLGSSMPGAQAFAATKDKGIEVKVDRAELDKSVKNAQDAGVPVTKDADVDKGVAKSKSEVDAKIAGIKKDYRDQIQAINAKIQKKKDCDAKQQEYEKLKAKYDQDLAQYEKDKKKYDQDLKTFNSAMAELEKHKNEDGYMVPPSPQLLEFKSEPNAELSLSGRKYTKEEFDSIVKSWNLGSESWRYTYFDILNNGQSNDAARVMLEKDIPFVATYTNLSNSNFGGKKISKVVYTYTFKGVDGVPVPDKLPVVLQNDPTVTIWYNDFFGDARISLNVQFYDDQGQLIDPTGSLLSFSSLNRGNGSSAVDIDAIEKVASFNGEFIPISGSSIKVQPDGGAYANEDNTSKDRGSRFDVSEWDTPDAQSKWYGAIVGRVTSSEINLDMGSHKSGCVWFALNSDIKALGVPIKPVEPKKPTPPEKPQCPVIQVNYHYDVLFYQPPVEKKVSNAGNADINNGMVKKGEVVKFALNASDFPAGREKIEKLAFEDTLPEGYEIDLASTKAASQDYDVEYNKDSRLLVFKAKDALLTKINADLVKDAKVPSPTITGKVTKEGTTYKNDFDMEINNVYKVKSNPVTVHTPTDPVKKVFKKGNTQTNIDGKKVEPGQELTYAITYKNTTGKDVTATITDKIPAHTTFVSADNDGKEAGGIVTWKKAVEKGKSLTVTFNVKVNKTVNGEPVDNKAKVNDGTNDYDTNETHNPTPSKPVKEVLEFQSTTKIDGKRVEPGQKITYSIKYVNTTGKEADVTITDKIPAHTKFVSADNDGKEAGGVVTWKKKVAKGDSFVVKFTVEVDKDVNGNVVTNKAKANDGENDYDTNEVTNPTPTKPEKEVFKGSTTTKIDGKVVKGGDELTYAITYKNTTGEDVKATITDKIPAHTKFVSADNGGTEKDGVVTWEADVAKDKSITVKFTVKVDEDVNGQPIDNIAKVNDGKNDYDTNKTHNPTPTKPKKEVFTGGTTTNIDGVRVKPGQKLTYAITYKNTTGEERDVTITDKLPAHTTFVSADNGGKYAKGKVTWMKKVAKGETFKVTFTVKVDKDVNGQTLTNTARVNDGVNDSDTNTVKNPTPKVPKKPNDPNKPHGPSTGDNSNIMFMLMLLLASGGALGSAAYMRRKRQ